MHNAHARGLVNVAIALARLSRILDQSRSVIITVQAAMHMIILMTGAIIIIIISIYKSAHA